MQTWAKLPGVSCASSARKHSAANGSGVRDSPPAAPTSSYVDGTTAAEELMEHGGPTSAALQSLEQHVEHDKIVAFASRSHP